jgi:hypothetical protein
MGKLIFTAVKYGGLIAVASYYRFTRQGRAASGREPWA